MRNAPVHAHWILYRLVVSHSQTGCERRVLGNRAHLSILTSTPFEFSVTCTASLAVLLRVGRKNWPGRNVIWPDGAGYFGSVVTAPARGVSRQVMTGVGNFVSDPTLCTGTRWVMRASSGGYVPAPRVASCFE